jgi:FKBP-type peptidyl-prolyl cis-trans isomerase
MTFFVWHDLSLQLFNADSSIMSGLMASKHRKSKITTTMKIAFVVAALTVGTITALSIGDRRAFVAKSLVGASSIGATVINPMAALADEDPYKDYITTESGLRYTVIKEGTGAVPNPGDTVKAHYTGWLDSFDSEKKFDSSRDRNRPFTFRVGAGQVIRGWDESFATMSVGERRKIVLPPRLGYGDRGAGGIIPGGATLYFDVELLGIQ